MTFTFKELTQEELNLIYQMSHTYGKFKSNLEFIINTSLECKVIGAFNANNNLVGYTVVEINNPEMFKEIYDKYKLNYTSLSTISQLKDYCILPSIKDLDLGYNLIRETEKLLKENNVNTVLVDIPTYWLDVKDILNKQGYKDVGFKEDKNFVRKANEFLVIKYI